jgi:hypothetical protein
VTDEPRGRDCTYCPEPGADVCVRTVISNSGPDRAVDAHRACAEAHGVPVLFEYLGTIRAEHFG